MGRVVGRKGFPPEAERFWMRVEKTDSCWVWLAGRGEKGYGTFYSPTRQGPMRAHRWSYENEHGAIPDGFEIDHLCRNRACVRPDHMEVVTHLENARRAMPWYAASKVNLSKTTCPHGHPYSGANLYLTPKGHRRCRRCNAERETQRRHAASD